LDISDHKIHQTAFCGKIPLLVTLRDFATIFVFFCSENVAYPFSADEFNTNFTTLATRTACLLRFLTFLTVPSYRVMNFFVLMRIVLRHLQDSIQMIFIKLLLPLLPPVLTQLFNFILTSSSFKFQKLIQIRKNLTITLFLSFLASQMLYRTLYLSRWPIASPVVDRP
jgi:hypothetical protein